MIKDLEATVTNVEDLKQLFRMVGGVVYGYSISEHSDDQIIYDLNEEVFDDMVKYDVPKSVDKIAEESFKFANEHRKPYTEIFPIYQYIEGVNIGEFEEAVVFRYVGEMNVVYVSPNWVSKRN